MGRVVCVSNRVLEPRKAAQAGGVAVAIFDILRHQDGLWFGWSGNMAAEPGGVPNVTPVGRRGSALATIDLSEAEYRDYYLGYANSVLWPVFHNRVDLAQFEQGFYQTYSSVNRRFAEALRPLLKPDDLLWIHDYQLIPLAAELRGLGVENRVGFFLHIPFPPPQAFLAVPEHLSLAHALAAYDVVGLQTTGDVANMLDYLVRGAHGRILPDGRIQVGERKLTINSFPIGIDPTAFLRRANSAEPEISVARIIGVDRLDYTKGLPQKFRGFGRFLERYPDHRKKITLNQIAAPSRESVEAYCDIRKELESLSGAINGKFGEFDWTPIHYINRATSRRALAAIYRSSRIGLVTPLRDGINLVAKEYVAAQDEADPGVLILSRFAGAAEAMTEALRVNPYNIDEIADAIAAALDMSLDERLSRHAALLRDVVEQDAAAWSRGFISRLRGPAGTDAVPEPQSGSLRSAMARLNVAPPPPRPEQFAGAGVFP